MNEVILALHKRLENMKNNLPSEAVTVEQINKYFLEQLSLRDVEYNLGKDLCTAWNKDVETLG